MAFADFILKKVSENCWRLSDVSLLSGQNGTIGFSDKLVPAEASIVAPNWEPYELGGDIVSLQDMVHVSTEMTGSVSTPVAFTKAGTTHADFLITIINDTDGIDFTGEIYIELAGH